MSTNDKRRKFYVTRKTTKCHCLSVIRNKHLLPTTKGQEGREFVKRWWQQCFKSRSYKRTKDYFSASLFIINVNQKKVDIFYITPHDDAVVVQCCVSAGHRKKTKMKNKIVATFYAQDVVVAGVPLLRLLLSHNFSHTTIK